MDTPTRRRRHERSPKNDRVVLNDRAATIFRLLNKRYRFKYLTTKAIAKLLDVSDPFAYDGLQRRLRNLFDAGYLDRPYQQRRTENTNYKDLVYERTDKAARAVDEDGDTGHRSNSYPHEVLTDLGYQMPLVLAVKEKNWKLHTAKDLMAGATFTLRTKTGVNTFGFPQTTRDSKNPFIGDSDLAPHVIERTDDVIFIPIFQADRNTESLQNIDPKDPARTTLTKHLDEIISFHQRKLFQSHYGFNSAMYPVITTNETHTQNAINYVKERIGACGYILFKTVPDIAYLDHFPAPSSEYFTTPWRRAGMPDFVF